MTVTAEGVETKEQLAQLQVFKCELAQGYFFSRPLDSLTAEVLLVQEFHQISPWELGSSVELNLLSMIAPENLPPAKIGICH